jgi:hypothetical protein
MKRSIGSDAEPTSFKRVKRSSGHDFDNPSSMQRVSELDAHAKDGFINAKVTMVWTERNTMRLKELETSISFDIVLSSTCLDILRKCRAELLFGDHILLSLRGAQIERRITGEDSSTMVIRFLGDIAFKWISSGKSDGRKGSYNGLVCDTSSGKLIPLYQKDSR